jgi:hypothetical protein
VLDYAPALGSQGAAEGQQVGNAFGVIKFELFHF